MDSWLIWWEGVFVISSWERSRETSMSPPMPTRTRSTVSSEIAGSSVADFDWSMSSSAAERLSRSRPFEVVRNSKRFRRRKEILFGQTALVPLQRMPYDGTLRSTAFSTTFLIFPLSTMWVVWMILDEGGYGPSVIRMKDFSKTPPG